MTERLSRIVKPSHMLGAVGSNKQHGPSIPNGFDDKGVLSASSFGNDGHALILAQIKQTQRVNDA